MTGGTVTRVDARDGMAGRRLDTQVYRIRILDPNMAGGLSGLVALAYDLVFAGHKRSHCAHRGIPMEEDGAIPTKRTQKVKWIDP